MSFTKRILAKCKSQTCNKLVLLEWHIQLNDSFHRQVFLHYDIIIIIIIITWLLPYLLYLLTYFTYLLYLLTYFTYLLYLLTLLTLLTYLLT